jgi:hypothetical protein
VDLPKLYATVAAMALLFLVQFTAVLRICRASHREQP